MNNFIYENSTKVYFGQGCVKEFLSSLTRDSRNILLACGEWSAKQYGVYDEVLNILMADEKNVVDFSGIMPNPTYEKVLEGIHLAKSHDIDLVLGIGGGSVMDCAKAVSLGARCSGDPWENFWERKGIVDFAPIPVGVIPTTAGRGSECNGAAVITNEKTKVKIGYDYAKCNPVFALMDPVYTYSVPEKQMVSGAFDSLSHIMETYFSEPDEQNVSDEIGEALMRSVIRNTQQAVRDGAYTLYEMKERDSDMPGNESSNKEKTVQKGKWKDVTEYFSEEQRHYKGTYLEQDEVYDETVEVSIFSSPDGPYEIYFSFDIFYGIAYAEPDKVYAVRDEMKKELAEEYDKANTPSDEFIHKFTEKYDVSLPSNMFFDFDLF